MKAARSRNSTRWLAIFAGCAVLALPPLAAARSLAQKKALALAQFKTAEKMREALNGSPQSDRSQRDYARAIAAYDKVYLITPNSSRADASIVAAAELLAEEGRAFDDPKSSEDSIKKYKFLMDQYPGSKHRTEAMFTIGKIYQEDLQDGAATKGQFEDFLKLHPKHPLSEAAREAMQEIDHPKSAPKSVVAKKKSKSESRASKSSAAAPAKTASAGVAQNVTQNLSENAGENNDAQNAQREAEPPLQGRRPLVTGIRHWSTPDYTRVAIDLEQEVKYEAGRIPSPDRIFFDLHGTKLAPELVGKSFDVDDGFLKKIRVAQYQPGMTRVVLEVPPVSEYSAFMLPNPYRLIIDIHGRQPAATLTAKAKADVMKEALADGGSPNGASAKNIATPSVAAPTLPSKTKSVEAKSHAEAADEWSSSKRGNVNANRDVPPVNAVAAVHPPALEHAENSPAPPNKAGSPAGKTKVISDESRESVPEVKEDDAKQTGSTAADDKRDEKKEVKATAHPTTGPTFEEVTPRPAARPRGAHSEDKSKEFAEVAREAKPSSDGQRTLIRALGLKIGKIVVDAGHGGHDTGTIGPHGLMEKDLVLDVALRLGKILENKMGAEVVYTRNDDTFIPLETRTAIANQDEADLFISVHANSSHDSSARGVETYYLNFTSSADALEVAARENAVSETSIHELQDLVKKIALKEKIDESHEFASDVQHALQSGLSTGGNSMRDRGVKKAPFIVLIGANMPSILAEISFVSNPKDERKLQTPAYRQKIAESLYRGVADYVRGLSGVKLAAANSGK